MSGPKHSISYRNKTRYRAKQFRHNPLPQSIINQMNPADKAAAIAFNQSKARKPNPK